MVVAAGSDCAIKLVAVQEDEKMSPPTEVLESMIVANPCPSVLTVCVLVPVKVTVEPYIAQRRILPQDVDFWFRKNDGSGRRSLGDRVLQKSNEDSYLRLKNLLHRKLDYKEVGWKSITALVKIVRQ